MLHIRSAPWFSQDAATQRLGNLTKLLRKDSGTKSLLVAQVDGSLSANAEDLVCLDDERILAAGACRFHGEPCDALLLRRAEDLELLNGAERLSSWKQGKPHTGTETSRKSKCTPHATAQSRAEQSRAEHQGCALVATRAARAARFWRSGRTGAQRAVERGLAFRGSVLVQF